MQPDALLPNQSIRKIALRIRSLLNVQIYGLDVTARKDGVDVIDINMFPGFVGAPQAAEKLAS